MSVFELIPSSRYSSAHGFSGQYGLRVAVLLDNAKWFTKIRWLIIFVFLIAGFAGKFVPDLLMTIGVIMPPLAPWIFAVVLSLSNIVFCSFINRLGASSHRRVIEANIWVQILFDLIIVTILVHIVGSTNTFIAFTYLFHIVLACIFFSKKQSFFVALLASILYLLCIYFELSGKWSADSIFIGALNHDSSMTLILALSAVFAWFVIWYLISTLSQTIRQRDQQLAEINNQLIHSDHEKTMQVLRTTHDLKAPFSIMESNIQLLRTQYWDSIPEKVRDIIELIETRSQVLRIRIKDILLLGELRSKDKTKEKIDYVDLHAVLASVINMLKEKAELRKISIDFQVPEMLVCGSDEKLTILFMNLIANAILYSHEGGQIKISTCDYDGEVCISISDQGIGIKDNALPHIFDEYFRTEEGARFNKMSTGLGLAIVKEIAMNTGIKIKVESNLGKGTNFKVTVLQKEGQHRVSPNIA